MWQANHTISYQGDEYFPSLSRFGIVSSEDLLLTNYDLTVGELQYQGYYYLWDLQVTPFQSVPSFDPQ